MTTGTTATDLEIDALRGSIAADLPAYLADLEKLVNIDCGTYTPDGVDEVGRWAAGFLSDLGRRRSTSGPIPSGRFGNTVVATFHGMADGPRVLLIGHMDTVFDPGTAAERPFRIDDGIAHGPGVTDMKSGLLAGLYALKAIIGELGGLPFERLTFIANPDEEIGSPTSVDHIREAAADVDVVPGPRVCPRQRRHRVGPQGHPRHAVDGPRPRRPRRASSRRRGAARSSRPPGSSATCTRSTAAGRA